MKIGQTNNAATEYNTDTEQLSLFDAWSALATSRGRGGGCFPRYPEGGGAGKCPFVVRLNHDFARYVEDTILCLK